MTSANPLTPFFFLGFFNIWVGECEIRTARLFGGDKSDREAKHSEFLISAVSKVMIFSRPQFILERLYHTEQLITAYNLPHYYYLTTLFGTKPSR
jgi:hypothetical protein